MNTPRRNFMAVDLIFLGYCAFVIAVVLLSPHSAHRKDMLFFFGGLAAFYLGMQRLGMAHQRAIVARQNPPLWLSAFGVAYTLVPMFLIPLSFLQLGFVIEDMGMLRDISLHPDFVPLAGHYDPDNADINGFGRFGAATYNDLMLKNLDVSIFGVYLPEWARQFRTPWLTGVLQWCYCFYYIAPALAIVPLMFQRRWREVRMCGALVGGCILLTYIIYLFVPATGPRFEGGVGGWMPAADSWFGAEALYRAVNGAETFRWNAFPSGHVAVSLVALVIALRYNRKLGVLMILPVLGLCLATICLGYHYGVDVLAGSACSILSLAIIPPLTRAWERPAWGGV